MLYYYLRDPEAKNITLDIMSFVYLSEPFQNLIRELKRQNIALEEIVIDLCLSEDNMNPKLYLDLCFLDGNLDTIYWDIVFRSWHDIQNSLEQSVREVIKDHGFSFKDLEFLEVFPYRIGFELTLTKSEYDVIFIINESTRFLDL